MTGLVEIFYPANPTMRSKAIPSAAEMMVSETQANNR